MAEQVVERTAFAIVGEPGILRVALVQALLLQGATDVLCDVRNADILRGARQTAQNLSARDADAVNDILRRMKTHQSTKRALRSWQLETDAVVAGAPVEAGAPPPSH